MIALGVLAQAVLVSLFLEFALALLVGLLSELAVVLGFLRSLSFSASRCSRSLSACSAKLAFAFLALGILAEAVFIGLVLEFALALLVGLISEHAVVLGVSAITIGIAAVTLVELLVPAIALILLMLLARPAVAAALSDGVFSPRPAGPSAAVCSGQGRKMPLVVPEVPLAPSRCRRAQLRFRSKESCFLCLSTAFPNLRSLVRFCAVRAL